jgi:capsular polysaccharide biosynthesis protein
MSVDTRERGQLPLLDRSGMLPCCATPCQENEISLVDLCLIMVKHKIVFLSVLALALVVGMTIAVFRSFEYSYVTIIEIGSFDNGNLYEAPKAVQVKIQDVYLPSALQSQANERQDGKNIELMVQIPAKTDLIKLRSKGSIDHQEAHFAVHNVTVRQLLEDHGRIFEDQRQNLRLKLELGRNELASMHDSVAVLEARFKRLDDKALLITKEVANLQDLIAKAEKNRERSINEADDEAKAMALLMISNEIQSYRTRLSRLEERLKYVLPNERDELVNQLAKERRDQLTKGLEIKRLQSRLDGLRQTRMVAPTMQSQLPTGRGSRAVLLISALLGLLGAIVSVFLVEFLKKISNRQVDDSPDSAKVWAR